MGRRKFHQLRLALFANSYCGKHLAKILGKKYERDRAVALKEISVLANALNFRRQGLLDFIVKGKSFRRIICLKYFTHSKDVQEIPIFLSIEKEMMEITDNRFLQDILEVEDYPGSILSSAVERAIGNSLDDVDNDVEFEARLSELKGRYFYCYYQVAYRYKLPTIRILPFIIRLISL